MNNDELAAVTEAAPQKDTRVFARKKAIDSESGKSELVVRVLCVDDHEMLLEGMKVQIESEPDLDFVGGLRSVENLIPEIQRLRPDVVLLDMEMPGPDVFEAADQLHYKLPKLPFIFLTAHIRDSVLSAAYRCGASGYFVKSDSLPDIMAGIRKVVRAKRPTFVMGPKVIQLCPAACHSKSGNGSRRAESNTSTDLPASVDQLTAREIAILRLIGKGLSRVEIAKEFSRSPKTIDGHQERMMKKLAIDSRSGLIRFAIREGLASIAE